MVAEVYGATVTLPGLRARFGASPSGMSLRSMISYGSELGLGGRAVRIELDDLKHLKLPAILHWNQNHFVVLTRVATNRVELLDPARGPRLVSTEELSGSFTGVALEFSPLTDLGTLKAGRRLQLVDLFASINGWRSVFVQLIVLLTVVQVLAVVLPLSLQLIVDEAIARSDLHFLHALILGFAGIHLLYHVAVAARASMLLVIGNSLGFQMVGNVFHHLIRLPVQYFSSRYHADIVSRMQSTQPIQRALSDTVLAALADSVLVIAVGGFMLVYSRELSFVVLASTAALVVVALAFYPVIRQREEEQIYAQAVEQAHILETLKASTALKLFGHEAEREAMWRNRMTEWVNASVRVGKVKINYDLVRSTIVSIQTLGVLYLGARMVMDGELTLGMFFAFMAFRQQFTDLSSSLVKYTLEFRMLSLHLDRLSDIVFTQKELVGVNRTRRRLQGNIDVDAVSFRYSNGAPLVLEDASMSVRAGEFVAIVGDSGGGKTTLLKIMLGLLAPERGQVRIDALSLSEFGVDGWRAQLGVVTQEDQLLSGTIVENISFFDAQADIERVEDCARDVGIHDAIMKRPMNYLTAIGDMGTQLSGGERQRLLLARALYRAPRVLFLDEGTSNLDLQAERDIADLIESLDATRIVIAHRPELVSRADRVFQVENRRLEQIDPTSYRRRV